MEDKVGIIIQSRLGSERLPGKILLEACGKPFLELLLERLPKELHPIVATTTKSSDLPIVTLCEKLGVPIYRGSEEDVLGRTYEAAKTYHLNTIIRITSDCPLMDPEIVKECFALFKEKKVDYLSNVIERTYPRGMDVEIFSFKALETASKEAVEPYDREHVTPFIRRHGERFKFYSVKGPQDRSSIRLTLDTPEDLRLLRAVFESLYPKNRKFGLQEILELLDDHPDWINWNKDVKQKS